MRLSVGLVSDTHGLLRAEVLAALEGSDLIVHAGDVGSPDVLDGLRRIAPTFAVRGNNDRGSWAEALGETEVVQAGSHLLYVIHDLGALDLEPRAAGFAAVISGHSHRPSVANRGGVLYVNPGSAGPRRFTLPIAIARLDVAPSGLTAEICELAV